MLEDLLDFCLGWWWLFLFVCCCFVRLGVFEWLEDVFPAASDSVMSRCFVYSLIWPFEHLRMWLNNNTVFRQRLHREENEIGAEFFPRFSQYDRRSVCVCVLRVFMGKHSFRIKMSPVQLGWTPLEVQETLFFLSFLSFFFKKKQKHISLFFNFFYFIFLVYWRKWTVKYSHLSWSSFCSLLWWHGWDEAFSPLILILLTCMYTCDVFQWTYIYDAL